MLKSFLLIFDPANTWERIAATQQSVLRVFFLFLLPLMLVAGAAEGYGLVQWGARRGGLDRLSKVPQDLAIRYAVTQFSLGLLTVFAGSWLLKAMAEGFHRRHTYAEAFTTLAYSFGPYFLLRLLDVIPAINTWICWSIGILLSVSALYRGIPRIIRPDPSSALGLYLLCSLLLMIAAGVTHFMAVMVLEEKFLASPWGPDL